MFYRPTTRNARIAYNKLANVALKIGYEKTDFKIISRMLNKEFKSLKVRFRFIKRDDIGPFMICRGFYNTPKINEDCRFEVDVIYGPKGSKLRVGFYTELYLILVHEFRHAHQDKARGFRKRRKPVRFKEEDMGYLMDYDEIDAYAIEVAEAMKMGNKNTSFVSYLKYRERPEFKKTWRKFLKKVCKYSGGLRPCF